MKKIVSFNQSNAGEVRVAINKALEILSEVGLKASIGNIRYDSSELRTKLTITPSHPKSARVGTATVVPMGENDSLSDYALYMKYLNKNITLQGSIHTVTAFKARNRKYPFIIEDEKGRSYKVSRTQLLRDL